MRRLVTFVFGVLVGVGLAIVGTLTTVQLQAGQDSRQRADMVAVRKLIENQPATRLIEIPAPRGQDRVEGVGQNERVLQAPPSMVFLKDLKTDGCWLAFMGPQNGPISLAVAPADACQQ